MRILSEREVKLVAGGYDTSGWDDGATVWGTRYGDYDPSWYGPGDEFGDGTAGGANPPQEPNQTPCVETTLESGVSTTEANRAALAASNAIAALNDENFEYSSIIWTLNGQVGHTDPYTDGLTDQVNWLGGISQVPTGAIIIAIVHNHPDDRDIVDTYPSGAGREHGEDWTSYDRVVNWNRDHSDDRDLPRGITVDANMLLYIYTNETGRTYVYDKTGKSQTRASCSLQ